MQVQLNRWAMRNGNVVEWGNVVGGFCGQEFREVFATEAEAVERERQAKELEAIGADRLPIALSRKERH